MYPCECQSSFLCFFFLFLHWIINYYISFFPDVARQAPPTFFSYSILTFSSSASSLFTHLFSLPPLPPFSICSSAPVVPSVACRSFFHNPHVISFSVLYSFHLFLLLVDFAHPHVTAPGKETQI